MAVYTVLERSEIEQFILPYGIGPLIDFKGVADGIENSNYFITTDQSDFPSELRTAPVCHYVLTIFESASPDDLTYYVDLTTLLNRKGLPVPCPVRDADGIAIHYIQGKPAQIVPRVAGRHPTHPTPEQCRALGSTLARVHQACMDWPVSHPGTRSLAWLQHTAELLSPHLSVEDRALLEELPRFEQLTQTRRDLPRAAIHGDLFRDNALFEGDTLTGLIDFNSASEGFLLFDLAVVVNDWCSSEDDSLNPALTSALLDGYRSERQLTKDELALWNDFLRLAALRFWLSRRLIQQDPESGQRPGSLVEFKDPEEFRRMLLHRIQHPNTL